MLIKNANDAYVKVVKRLPIKERLRLAALILGSQCSRGSRSTKLLEQRRFAGFKQHLFVVWHANQHQSLKRSLNRARLSLLIFQESLESRGAQP